jgi:hypothetical protein
VKRGRERQRQAGREELEAPLLEFMEVRRHAALDCASPISSEKKQRLAA